MISSHFFNEWLLRRLVWTGVVVLLLGPGCGAGPPGATASPEATTPTEATAFPETTTSSEATAAPESSVGEFVLKDIDGRTHALSDYLGKKVVVLTFFAMWCEPCKKEMGHLAELYEARSEEGLMVLAISMDEPETQGEVRPFVKKRGFGFPVLFDTEGRATDQFNPRKDAPFNLIIDRNRAAVWSRAGYSQGDEKVLEDAVLKALGNQ